MPEQPEPGIFLIVEFNWPKPMDEEAGKNAYHLHQVVQGKTWIRETVAASGGVGQGRSSIWIFWLENYAALDRLLRDENDEISQAYIKFYKSMERVTEKVREEVLFG